MDDAHAHPSRNSDSEAAAPIEPAGLDTAAFDAAFEADAPEAETATDSDRDLSDSLAAALGEAMCECLRECAGGPVRLCGRRSRREAREDFRAACGEPTLRFALEWAPSNPLGWLVLPAEIAFALHARLLGGEDEEIHIPRRPLTRIERRVIGRLLRPLAARIAGLLGRSEDRSPAAAEPGPWLRVCTFALEIGPHAGAVRLALPEALLPREARTQTGPPEPPPAETETPDGTAADPPTDPPSETPAETAAETAHETADGPASEDTHAPQGTYQGPDAAGLELTVCLDEPALEAEDLAGLRTGDLIVTDAPAGGEATLRVAGIPKFLVRLGRSNGRRAAKILRRLDGPDGV